MCKRGDIILIYNAIYKGKPIGMHSFVVLDDNEGNIRGVKFDFIALVMSSMGTKEKEEKLMSYPYNFPITPDEKDIINSDSVNMKSCIKASQFYYFNKNKIRYKTLGKLNPEIFNLLIEFIQEISKDGAFIYQVLDKT